MTGQRDDIMYNICSSRADNYNYALKSDFLSYHWWEKRDNIMLSTFPGVWQEPLLLQIWRQRLVIANPPSVREGESTWCDKLLLLYICCTITLVLHKCYPSHLCLRREVLPGAKEQRGGKSQGTSSNSSGRNQTSMQENGFGWKNKIRRWLTTMNTEHHLAL